MKQFRDLSYEDLNSWVGQKTASRGRSYKRSGHVSDIYQITDDIICGSVEGTKEYHTGLYVVEVSFLMKGKAASHKSGKSVEFDEYIVHLKTEHAKKPKVHSGSGSP